jgi:hypothetical protein
MSTKILESVMHIWPLRRFGEDFFKETFVNMNCRWVCDKNWLGEHGLCVNSNLSNDTFFSVVLSDQNIEMGHFFDDYSAFSQSFFVFLYRIYFVPPVCFLNLRNCQYIFQNVLDVALWVGWLFQRGFENFNVLVFTISCEFPFLEISLINVLSQFIDSDSS